MQPKSYTEYIRKWIENKHLSDNIARVIYPPECFTSQGDCTPETYPLGTLLIATAAMISIALCCSVLLFQTDDSEATTVASGTIDAVSWEYDSDGTLTVSGNGPITNGNQASPSVYWGQYPYTNVVISEGITNAGYMSFRGHTSLESVTLPSTLTSLGWAAFEGCSSLESITIPENVTSISAWTFRGCTSLTSVTMPNSLQMIEEEAFSNCKSLTSITIPNSVTEIKTQAFYKCTALTSITLSNTLEIIGDQAFSGCKSIGEITFPLTLTQIGNKAFCDCSALRTVSNLDNVENVGELAFSGCAFNQGSSTTIIINGPVFVFSATDISKAINDAKGNGFYTLTIPINGCKILFDNAAVASLKNEEAQLSVDTIPYLDMNQSMRDIVGNSPVFSISFGNNTEFGEGNASITVPYSLEKGQDPSKLKVYYLKDDEVAQKLPCTYEDGFVTFKTNHFSDYAVIYESEQTSFWSTISLEYIAIIAVAIMSLAGDIIILKKKQN